MNAESQVDEKGRVCIPADLRKKLNITTGEKLFFQLDEAGRIVLRKLTTPDELKKKAKELKKILKEASDSPLQHEKLF
ncbi:MAG: AbrB/MazE/SpoVT family DNA-binding domain-containing protein [Candidatus Sigynarchaeota archaeon]